MAADQGSRSSRRTVLAAAAGAAALAASRLVEPAVSLAVNPPLLLNQDNPTSAMILITINGVHAFKVTTGTQATAIWGLSGSGVGVSGVSTSGVGVVASSDNIALNAVSTNGLAVDASSNAGTAMRGWTTTGTGVLGHVGMTTPTPRAGVALQGSVSAPTQVGLRAAGRVLLPDRSGRATIAAGASTVSVTVPGVNAGNFAIATLGTNQAGRWVRAVVCYTNKITICLNTAVTASSSVNWLVLG